MYIFFHCKLLQNNKYLFLCCRADPVAHLFYVEQYVYINLYAFKCVHYNTCYLHLRIKYKDVVPSQYRLLNTN